MAYTIGDEAWEYIDLLNECIKMLLTIGLGVTMGYFEIFDAKTFVPQAVKFVFHVALPLLILRGIGVSVDFYDETFQWEYIEAFLILRVFGLVLCVGWVLAASTRGGRQEGIGQVAVLWLALTWISTVILGVPISKAVFGTEAQGMKYGLVSRLNLCVGYTIALFMSHAHLSPDLSFSWQESLLSFCSCLFNSFSSSVMSWSKSILKEESTRYPATAMSKPL
jgi:hypothetical protein